MRRLLITGASGFIGRWCVEALRRRFSALHAVSRRKPKRDVVEWHACDLLNDDVEALCQRVNPTHLLHLAWIATPGEYWTSPLNHRWFEASCRLLDAFIACGGKRMVGVGTCAEYDWGSGICVEDKTPLSGRSPYAESKIRFFEHALKAAEDVGLAFAWARLFFVFGPGEPAEKLVSSVMRNLRLGQVATCSAGGHVRDFVYVKNVAAALACLMDADVTGSINVGSGTAMTVRDFVEPIARKWGRPDLLRFTRAATGEAPRVQADVTRLCKELGFRPPFDLNAAREDVISWWQAEAIN